MLEGSAEIDAGDRDRRFATPRERHMVGRLAAAARLDRTILDRDAGHADTPHLPGVEVYRRGRHIPARDPIGQAITRALDNARYHSDLGNVPRDRDELDAATGGYEAALVGDADVADVMRDLGATPGAVGRIADGIAMLERAAAPVPERAKTCGNPARPFDRADRRNEAIAAARTAAPRE